MHKVENTMSDEMPKGPSLEDYTAHINELRNEWCASKRNELVEFAKGEIGDHKGGHPRVTSYWRDVLPPNTPEASLIDCSKRLSWCQVFCLFCLRHVGLTDAHWVFGRGFVYPLGLKPTDDPQPGDLGYFHNPYQHMDIVVELNKESGMLTTVDGNQPDCRLKTRKLPKGAQFFSIDKLLLEALDDIP